MIESPPTPPLIKTARTTLLALVSTVSLAALVPTLARAEEPIAAANASAQYAFGGRVGGYGFRQAPTEGADHTGWTDCRMNGIGLFGQRTLGRNFFAEAGLDYYFSDQFPTGGHTHGDADVAGAEPEMDRASALASIAGGVRFYPGARFTPYLQIGAGIELTRVAMPAYEMEDSFVLPNAFLGFGGDVRIGKGLRVGANLRVHVMGHFDHDSATSAMQVEPEFASQGQFYAKIDL